MLNKGYQIERTSYANLDLDVHDRINDLHRRADRLAPAVSESALDSGCTDMTKASREQLGPRQRKAWDMVAEAHAWNSISDKPEELAKAEAAERAGQDYTVEGVSGADFFFTYVVKVETADERAEQLQASAARHGHATRCTAHGRDLAECDPADCDEAALAASFTVTVYDSHPAGQDAPQAAQVVQTLRCRVCGHISTAPAGQDATDRLCCVCFEQGSYSFLVPQAELDAETEARREHEAAGPGHAAWCAGPSAHRATGLAEQGARFHHPRRGHFHDPVGLYDWCQDPTCSRASA